MKLMHRLWDVHLPPELTLGQPRSLSMWEERGTMQAWGIVELRLWMPREVLVEKRWVLLRGTKVTALQESRLMFQVSGMPQKAAALGTKAAYYSAQHYLSKINRLFLNGFRERKEEGLCFTSSESSDAKKYFATKKSGCTSWFDFFFSCFSIIDHWWLTQLPSCSNMDLLNMN